MTFPHSRIELWHGANMLYQLDDSAVKIHVKETLTDGIGMFSFTLPIWNGLDPTSKYNDVILNDTAKVWINYDSITGDPLTVGPICQIEGDVSKGYTRTFLCKNQSEILTRRFKTKNYVNTDASAIVTEWATDLGLGTGLIDADTNHENFFFDYESYFDCLRIASDYWVDATHQIKKDFYVDVNNNLVWKARPIRTAGVETLSFGGGNPNIMAYRVQRDETPVKNKLWIFGKTPKIEYDMTSNKMIVDGRKNPTDGDSWTESLTNWSTIADDTLTANSADKMIGTYRILCVAALGSPRKIDFWRTFDQVSVYGLDGYQTLNFWTYFSDDVANQTLRLWAPDSSNYFQLTPPKPINVWTRLAFVLGTGNEYDVALNPSGLWTKVGSPSWYNLQGIRFYAEKVVDVADSVDGLFFGHGRPRYMIQDATSQTDYGLREMTHVDDKLTSDSQCEQRGEALLYQTKDAPTRLDFTTPGNINIKIGDRLTQSLLPENISAADYDVVTVEHSISAEGFITKGVMVNSSNIREVPVTSTSEAVVQQYKRVRELQRDIKTKR